MNACRAVTTGRKNHKRLPQCDRPTANNKPKKSIVIQRNGRMTTTPKTIRETLYLLAVLLLPSMAFAQDSITLQNVRSCYIKNQMSVSVAYSRNTLIPYKIMEDRLAVNHIKGVNVQVLYGINNWFECGVALDIGYIKKLQEQNWPYPNFVLPSLQGHLGGTAKAHLLSAIWPEFYFLDLYAAGMIGASATVSTGGWPDARLCFLAQVGAGAGVNFSRHFGVFAEYGINTKKNPYTLFGLNVRFGGPKK